MLTGSQPQTGSINRGTIAGKPKAASLKGIRRQLDELRSRQYRTPIHPDTRHESLRRRSEEPEQAAVPAAKGGYDDGGGTSVGGGVLEAGDQCGMRTGFDESPVAAFGCGAHRLIEFDGLADVAEPIVGVQVGGVQDATGDRGEEDGVCRTRFDTGQRL